MNINGNGYEVNYLDIEFVVFGEYEAGSPATRLDPGDCEAFEITGVYLKDDPQERDLIDVLEVDTLNELESLVIEKIQAAAGDDFDEEDGEEE
jgi:hypothetical protein